jgi:hypothetical protein
LGPQFGSGRLIGLGLVLAATAPSQRGLAGRFVAMTDPAVIDEIGIRLKRLGQDQRRGGVSLGTVVQAGKGKALDVVARLLLPP